MTLWRIDEGVVITHCLLVRSVHPFNTRKSYTEECCKKKRAQKPLISSDTLIHTFIIKYSRADREVSSSRAMEILLRRWAKLIFYKDRRRVLFAISLVNRGDEQTTHSALGSQSTWNRLHSFYWWVVANVRIKCPSAIHFLNLDRSRAYYS